MDTGNNAIVKMNGSAYTALVIDDSQFMVKNLERMLMSFGIEAKFVAKNGEKAIRIYSKNKDDIDIITLDITMPGMNGITTLEQLRKINPEAKVIMVTALGHEQLVKQAVLRGAKYYIVKPFKRERIFDALKFVLGA